MFLPVTSDGKIFIQNGFRGIYIFSLEDYGYMKHYHQMSDTIDNMNFKNLDLAKDFVKELILKLDKEAWILKNKKIFKQTYIQYIKIEG